MQEVDYLAYYDAEKYLFETIGPKFRSTGSLDAFELFTIVIWKANRAKSKIAHRLIGKSGDLQTAAADFSKALHAAATPRRKLEVALTVWGFRLPMASAILCVLWPEEFTVYDVRVCNELNAFHSLKDIAKFDRIWMEYERYRQAVIAAVPSVSSLRGKDQYLWAKSAAAQLKKDITEGFIRIEAVAHSTYTRFTDQPQMESVEARYDADYLSGREDAKTGVVRNKLGTSQYHKGFSDGMQPT